MRAIFSISGNESQPGLQLVEKLATPLVSALPVNWCHLSMSAEPTPLGLLQVHIVFSPVLTANSIKLKCLMQAVIFTNYNRRG